MEFVHTWRNKVKKKPYTYNVSWMGALIRFSTAVISGEGSADDSESGVWKAGYKVSPSRRNQTFFAMVGRIEDVTDGVSPGMKELQGKTLEFEHKDDFYRDIYHGYYWKPEWIDRSIMHLKVKSVPYESVGSTGMTFWRSMQRFVGKTFRFYPCSGHYSMGDYCFEKEWLEPADNKKYKIGTVIDGSEIRTNLTWLPNMNKFVGHEMEFKKFAPELWEMNQPNGYVIHEKWIEWKEVNPTIDTEELEKLKATLSEYKKMMTLKWNKMEPPYTISGA